MAVVGSKVVSAELVGSEAVGSVVVGSGWLTWRLSAQRQSAWARHVFGGMKKMSRYYRQQQEDGDWEKQHEQPHPRK